MLFTINLNCGCLIQDGSRQSAWNLKAQRQYHTTDVTPGLGSGQILHVFPNCFLGIGA